MESAENITTNENDVHSSSSSAGVAAPLQKFFNTYLTTKKENLLDIPLNQFVTSHPHLYTATAMTKKGETPPRDLHHVCLKIINVEGIPDEIYLQLKERLAQCVYKWYYQPREGKEVYQQFIHLFLIFMYV